MYRITECEWTSYKRTIRLVRDQQLSLCDPQRAVFSCINEY